jgi:hypothetical protein
MLVPRDKLRVLGDDTHADDCGSSRSRLPESMPKECSAETPPALLGGNSKPLHIRHGSRSEFQRNASGHRSVGAEKIVGNTSTQV